MTNPVMPEGVISRRDHMHWLQCGDLTPEQRKVLLRYKCLSEVPGYAFWEWDFNRQTFINNGQLWQQAGYTVEEVESVTDAVEVRAFFHPDDVSIVLDAVREHMVSDTPIHMTYRILKKDGGYIWVTSLGQSRRDRHGLIINVSGVTFESSSMKQTQERLHESKLRHSRIMSSSNDGIWEWKSEGDRLEFSDRCWEHLGFQSLDEFMEEADAREAPNGPINRFLQAWVNRIHEEDFPRLQEDFSLCLQSQQQLDLEYRIAGKDGLYRWVRTRARFEFDDSGIVCRLTGTNMDITELKGAEERLSHARDAAERANQAKSDFLASMSHELRTPMNAIMGFAQLFDYDANLTDDQRENIREILKAGEHLLQLINDVLDLSKIESGNVTLSLEPVQVSSVIRDCVGLSHPLAAKHSVSLQADLDSVDDLFADCDSVRLKQVVLNLLSNAIKYNLDGGWVRVQIFPHDEDTLCISIEDNGVGISELKQKQLFQPFNRLGAENTSIEGTGVGLVITKRLVEMMGGHMTVYSQEDVGSCFEIYLKSRKDWSDLPDELLAQRHLQQKQIQLAIQSERKVLYIEDNQANVRLMHQFFQHIENVELVVAEESFLGLYKARTERPDLIILDINLPVIDGYEVLEVLRNDSITRDIPVVALTANAMSKDVARGEEAGFYAYMTKPLDIVRLAGILNEIFQQQLNSE
ncbi:PAS domain-containing protein [Marinibactrum halimedae]|uniref:histidine kinase n=1 Tax=Marinibactrum halimedae TaxID=1444977 RepID=A0AA37T9L9_9GAMM|nr:PAS domain-containing protein [Marinibactrum halimedae]MCD9458442.1 PAS domain-containing protein [Marinibactrum halimedae]GLS26140.1 hypothetical protein GCM10007877_18550 [Marinibactrum halimedae]